MVKLIFFFTEVTIQVIQPKNLLVKYFKRIENLKNTVFKQINFIIFKVISLTLVKAFEKEGTVHKSLMTNVLWYNIIKWIFRRSLAYFILKGICTVT